MTNPISSGGLATGEPVELQLSAGMIRIMLKPTTPAYGA